MPFNRWLEKVFQGATLIAGSLVVGGITIAVREYVMPHLAEITLAAYSLGTIVIWALVVFALAWGRFER